MRLLIGFLLCIFSITGFCQYSPQGGQLMYTFSQLRSQAANQNAWVYVLGKDSVNDGYGGGYRFDTSSTAVDDDYNVLAVTALLKGRWIRLNQNMITYPTGMLFKIAGFKFFAGSSTIGSSGEAVVNITTDGTATGAALFSNIFFTAPMAVRAATNAQDVVNSGTKSISSNFKTVTYKFTTGLALSALGATVILAPPGTSFSYFAIGL